MSLKKFVAALCCVALLAGPALAAPKVKITTDIFLLPSIALDGTVDFGLPPGPATAKLSLNLRTFVLTASAKGNVLNLAFVKVVFIDQDIAGLGGILGSLLKEKYTVTAKGKATYAGTFAIVI
jgi:hypothetical protein